jgi:DNA-binding GntR family transcriptional regulator
MLAGRRTKADVDALNQAIEDLTEIVENDDEDRRDPNLWSAATQRFHDTLLEHAGNKTLAVQAGVLAEVVAMHVSIAVRSGMANPDQKEEFRRTIRSYRKLVGLIEARDGEGAEKHWKVHMEAAGQRILGHGLGAKSVVDLFT